MPHPAVHGLDLIRFASALLVFFYHLGFSALAKPDHGYLVASGHPASMPDWGWFAGVGWVGVQIFFVLSGVVIVFSAKGATGASFLRGRAARLVPGMVISATLIALVSVAWNGLPVSVVALLWMNSVVFSPFGPWVVSTIWTLPVEIGFYGLVGVLVARQRLHRLMRLAWALLASSAAYWLVVLGLGVEDRAEALTRLFLFQHGGFFALGLAMAHAARRGLGRSETWLTGLAVALAYVQIHAASDRYVEDFPIAIDLAFAVWVLAVVLIAASLRWQAPIARLVDGCAPTIRLLGLATYPIYLLHMHVGGPVLVEMRRAGFDAGWGLAGAVAATLAVSLPVAAWGEPGLRRWMFRERLPGRTVPA